MFGLNYLKGVTTLVLDDSRCTGCGMCLKVCPHAVFARAEGSHKVAIVRLDACMECGACQGNCADGALSVKAGVGCAAGVLNGLLNGTEPSCDCGDGIGSSCC